MSSKRKLLITIVVVLAAALAISVLSVSAQDDDTTRPGLMGGRGQGRNGMGYGMHPGLASTAEVLGMEEDALIAELQSGKTFAEIAEEQGVELQTVVDDHQAAVAEHMAEMVEAGNMTQEQADFMLENMASNFAENGHFGVGYGLGNGECFGAQSDEASSGGRMGARGGRHGG